MPTLNALEPVLDDLAGPSGADDSDATDDADDAVGIISVWCGRPGASPAYARLPDATHYAASTMKLAVLAAAYRLHEAGGLDLDAEVDVHAEFDSASGDGRYHNDPGYDNDDQPWQQLGGRASLRWLARRMIVRSSNLATNLVLERVGFDAVAAVWRDAGARSSVVARGIEDYPAARAGRSNLVTAEDLARLLSAVRASKLAGEPASAEMLEVLLAQEQVDDVVRGLPPGTAVAHKNGWVDGIRHSAALIMPDDAPEFALVGCTTTSLTEQQGKDLIARIARAAWTDRHRI